MSVTVDEIVAKIEKMSAEDREVLMQRLLPIVDPPDPAEDKALIAEVERRLDALDRGETKTVPWEEARRRLGL